jgi:hypothetical protein
MKSLLFKDIDLTGLPAWYGTEEPRVDSGVILGISRQQRRAATRDRSAEVVNHHCASKSRKERRAMTHELAKVSAEQEKKA